MAKDNEKKVSGDMSDDELTNVAGGWCATGGVSMAKEVESMTQTEPDEDGKYDVIIKFKNGKTATAYCKSDGIVYGNNYSNQG